MITRAVAVIIVALGLTACRSDGARPTVQRLEVPTPQPKTVGARQAQEIVILGAFLRAYNAGDLRSARSSFGNQPTWRDCDYARGVAISGEGLESLTT